MTPRKLIPILLLILALAFPLLLRGTAYESYALHVAVQMMLLGVLAMTWDFTFGYLGMFSFGHAAFFGTGAYVGGMLVVHAEFTSGLAVTLVAVAAASFIGAIIGYLSARVGSVAVFLVTFACGEALFLAVLSNPLGLTNGDNGLLGVVPDSLLGIDLHNETQFYYLGLAVLIGSYLTLRYTINSAFGLVMMSIRENETRVRFAGYDVRLYKTAAFAIAGAFGGLAGTLTTFHERIASPEQLSWYSSAEAVLYATLGGIGTLFGPVLGASVVILAREVLSDHLDSWLIFVGLTYLLLVFFLPSGIQPLFAGKHQPKSRLRANLARKRS